MIDGNDAYIARIAICEAANRASAPSVLYRPRIFPDGNQWCALLGENLMEGVCGFGDTPYDACIAFDHAFGSERTPRAQLAQLG